MSNRSVFKKIFLCFITVMCSTVLFTGCVENADTAKAEEKPLYEEITQDTNDYLKEYSDFILNSSSETVDIISSEGSTPAGNSCTSTYVESKDSAYASLTLEVDRETEIVRDEYYRINPSRIFIVRYSQGEDSSLSLTEKYIIVDDIIYSIDDENQAVNPVDRPDSLDLYLSFEEICDKYGK